jgi:DNA primase
MAFDREIVEAVRERTDIVEIISRHVKLHKKGNRYLGLCPFHQEKTPSFNVTQDSGWYHCFGCKESGDVFKFLMQLEGVPFPEALKDLAKAAGIALPERELNPAERQALRAKATIREILEESAAFFESALWTHPSGAPAREYLLARNIDRETSRLAGLGYAPQGRGQTVVDALYKKGYSEQLLTEAGIARKGQHGRGYYSFFRDRLMIPIRDERGRVVSFGGRILSGDGPKYINTAETELYKKKRVLYGLDRARPAIQKKDRVIVVEGYFDVISMHAAGFLETVASCGTALTVDHLTKLRRLSTNVILLLDSDDAGQTAIESVVPLAVEQQMRPWHLSLGDDNDPDDFIQAEGTKGMERALEEKQPAVEWLIRRLIKRHGRDATGSDIVLREIAPLLAGLPTLTAVAARMLGVSTGVVEQTIRGTRNRQSQPGAPQRAEPESVWRPDKNIVHLLWLLIKFNDITAPIVSKAHASLFSPYERVKVPLTQLLEGRPFASVADEASPDVARVLSAIQARDELYTEAVAASAACEVLHKMFEQRVSVAQTGLSDAIMRAEHGNDNATMIELLQARVALTRRCALVRTAAEINGPDKARPINNIKQFLEEIGTIITLSK